jgi:hypothetical protein
VGGLLVTTHGIGNDDFMAGKSSFEGTGKAGSVVNQGQLQASLGGYIALLAPQVRNEGVIVAKEGTVALAAGDKVTLQFAGQSLTAVQVDRAVVDAVCSLPEKRRYLRSLVPWAGFRHEPVWYDRHARVAGETKYSARKLIMLVADALVISSDAPVRLTWLCSVALALLGALATGLATWSSMATPAGADRAGVSLAAVIAVAALVAAAQTAAVAIVGEYVVRIYRESQGRPTWVVRRTINDAGAAAPGGTRTDRPSRAA